MEQSFPFEKTTYDGHDYILMKSDVFYSFFLSMTKYVKNKKSTVNNICKQYEYATHIKRKRIKLKKEKEVLLSMYEFLFDNFIKK